MGITQGVDAFALESDGTLLVSSAVDATLPGIGAVDDADIVRFTPTSLGDVTAGAFTMVLDGSDVGLDTVGENVDAIGRAPDGRLVVSVAGNFSALGVTGGDEDLYLFADTQLGDVTAGSWALYFDGSDIALDTGAGEDIDGAWVDPTTGALYLTSYDYFTAGVGFGGDANDIYVCAPGTLGAATTCTLGLAWDGDAHGLSGGNLRNFTLVPAGVAGSQVTLPPAAMQTLHLPLLAAP